MKNINTINQWLSLGRKLTENCLARQDKIRDLEPSFTTDKDERKVLKKEISNLNIEISKTAADMAKLEGSDFGITKITPNPTKLERIIFTIMAMARLSPVHIKRDLEEVGDIANNAAGDDLKYALIARNYFREDSMFREHFSLQHWPTLDESNVRLTEKSLNKILGQKPDDSEILTASKPLKSSWRIS